MVERVARHETHALNGLFFGHDACHRRAERERAARRARLGQRLDLLVRNIPVAQARQAGVCELSHAVLRFFAGSLQGFDPLGSDCIFALCRNQLWAVDLEQGLALAHCLSGGIDMQAFDVTLEFGRDGVGQAFVGFNTASRSHHLVEGAQGGSFDSYPELLNLVGADFDLIGASRIRLLLAFVDRDVVHPHRIFFWRGGCIGQSHRIAVVKDLALLFVACRGHRRSRLLRSMRSRLELSVPVAASRGQCCRRQHEHAHLDFGCHSSSPMMRSMSARRVCAATPALTWLSLAWRICLWASSNVAKSTLPDS
ncbi:MAG: hypothetical protein ACD_23C00368G0002 [uncultured bacterium]|nr:MAG: hypothetical protein ACD_23C00368G0002 [uncultured bacterium]